MSARTGIEVFRFEKEGDDDDDGDGEGNDNDSIATTDSLRSSYYNSYPPDAYFSNEPHRADERRKRNGTASRAHPFGDARERESASGTGDVSREQHADELVTSDRRSTLSLLLEPSKHAWTPLGLGGATANVPNSSKSIADWRRR